jgi:hypothetical protein
MSHFNPKISIEVGPHSHATPLYGLYGDGFIVSRSDRSAYGHNFDLQLNAFLSNIAHAMQLYLPYPPRVALMDIKYSGSKAQRDIPPKRSDSDIATLSLVPCKIAAPPPWSIEAQAVRMIRKKPRCPGAAQRGGRHVADATSTAMSGPQAMGMARCRTKCDLWGV